MRIMIQLPTLIFFLCAAIGSFFLGYLINLIIGKRKESLLHGLEAAILSTLGAFLAAGAINGMFYLARGHQRGAGLAIGWGFFLIPGLIDTIRAIWSSVPRATTPQVLTWCALSIGALGGLMDGAYSVHRWKGFGVLTFLADYTWGLASSSLGCLIHIINIGWGRHTDNSREGGHLYDSGFRLMGTFAFTQGNVMSNLQGNGPGSGLFRHENTHVLQNRIFGPLFILSYIAWAVILFIPAMIAGGASRNATVREGIFAWCYRNVIWEAWARKVGGQTANEQMVIRTGAAIAIGIGYLLICLLGAVLIALAIFGIL